MLAIKAPLALTHRSQALSTAFDFTASRSMTSRLNHIVAREEIAA
jgi:hypothetical protein